MTKIFDNRPDHKLGEFLQENIKKDANLSFVSAYFTIYAFYHLKNQLKNIDKMRFLFGEPTFLKNINFDENLVFKVSKSKREKDLLSSEFEVEVRNKFTLRKVAKECADWIKEKVEVRSLVKPDFLHAKMYHIQNPTETHSIIGSSNLTSNGLGFSSKPNLELNLLNEEQQVSEEMLNWFNDIWNNESLTEDVKQKVLGYLELAYKEHSPEFVYYFSLYNIFKNIVDDLDTSDINKRTSFINSVIWNKLYPFQRDAVVGIINKLEKYNSCILADSVGLGKTFSALAVIKYFQEKNQRVLVLAPKKLQDNWNTYRANYKDNVLHADRLNYDVLFHTDLLREAGESNGIDLTKINWSNYDLIVIDESHNFRNNDARNDKQTRYSKLKEEIINTGIKTKVLLLSATPINNSFTDLKNQMLLGFEDEYNKEITKQNLEFVFRNAQKIFNEWSKIQDSNHKTKNELIDRLSENFDLFKVLDTFVIERSRQYIKKYYKEMEDLKFPQRLPNLDLQPKISENLKISDFSEGLLSLNLSIYTPLEFVLTRFKEEYLNKYDTKVSKNVSLSQTGREKGIAKLMRINLLKRLESSIDSFRITLERVRNNILQEINVINDFELNKQSISNQYETINFEILEDQDFYQVGDESIGDKIEIKIKDLDTLKYKQSLVEDLEKINQMLEKISYINPSNDEKLIELKKQIKSKILNQINNGNKKVLIFTAFSDTADYIYENIKDFVTSELNLHIAKISGSTNKNTAGLRNEFNELLSHFSPKSKEKNIDDQKEINILIGTDCISEGQNLQDCDFLINYDIHWNPVRIIQRFGRVDRIGSKNDYIKLVNFWPQIELEEYIKLKYRVENKMTLVEITGEEQELRKLQKLKNNILDIEDIETGITLTDISLNDFRIDLSTYIQNNPKVNFDEVPSGIHTSVNTGNEGISGVVYLLKLLKISKKPFNENIHPYYLIFIGKDNEVIMTHINVKKILDLMRLSTRGKKVPDEKGVNQFNSATNFGDNMTSFSKQLTEAIKSIVAVNSDSEIESIFERGGTRINSKDMKELSDFELVSFFNLYD